MDIARQDFNGDNARSLAQAYGHINIVRIIEQHKPKRRQTSNKKGKLQEWLMIITHLTTKVKLLSNNFNYVIIVGDNISLWPFVNVSMIDTVY